MAEKFIVVWTIDGETMSMPHSTQDEALQQAEPRAWVQSGDHPASGSDISAAFDLVQ
jgi:hypothetical protein